MHIQVPKKSYMERLEAEIVSPLAYDPGRGIFGLTSLLPLANVPNSVKSKGGDTMPLGVRDVLVLGVLGTS